MMKVLKSFRYHIAVFFSVIGPGFITAVVDNDADARGENAPVAGATVTVLDAKHQVVASARTGMGGAAGFVIPADVPARELVVSIAAEGFNSRHMRLDGTNVAVDLREALYRGVTDVPANLLQ